jgi:hypothetical protein
MGSVQLLENENYFIYTFGSGLNNGECSVLEITPDGDIVWKATSENQNAAWYRSYKIPSIHPSAFSIIANDYTTSEEGDNMIEMSGNSLDFSIHNTSGYNQPYSYQFSDLIDGGNQMFNYAEGEIILGSDESIVLSFLIADSNLESTTIGLSVWPTHHSYAAKELMFSVISVVEPGDINGDDTINVLDVVLLVNIILNSEDASSSADLNGDNVINVLDVVLLVNLILG